MKLLKVKQNDGEIFFDEFDRTHYKIMNSGEYINKSNIGIKFENINEYMKYITNINYLSNVYYNITKRCNMKCTYCYSNNENSSVSLDENNIIIDKLEKLRTRKVTLIGGEPFCHANFYEILERIKSMKNIEEICIVTNGTLIDKERLETFKDFRISLQISLDGANEEINSLTRGKGNFEKVMRTLEYLKNEDIVFKVMQVITRENIIHAKNFYKYFKDKEIETGFFMVKQVNEDIKPTLNQLKDLLDFIYINEEEDVHRVFDIVKFADNMMFNNEGFPITHCGAGINTISINPNGDVFPCVKRSEKKDLITNLLLDDCIETIEKNRLKIFKKDLVKEKEYCKECKIKYFCGGGCRAEEINGIPCEYNCQYFNFAFEYFGGKIYEK